jgi:hypothetical protein
MTCALLVILSTDASIATIGYEGATIASFQEALRDAGIDLLVDVRALARALRPASLEFEGRVR